MSGMLDVSAVLRMFVPWNSTARPPPSPKQATGKKDVSSPPAVRWELFRFFNWLTSITFLVCVAHLASVQRRGVSVFVHSKLVVLVSLLCLVRILDCVDTLFGLQFGSCASDTERHTTAPHSSPIRPV